MLVRRRILSGVLATAMSFGLMVFSPSVMAKTPGCVPLNERLSFCTTLREGRVSFMGATPGYVGALVGFLDTAPERSYFTVVRWNVGTSFNAYALKKREEFRAGRPVRSTSTGLIGGYPSIRYTFAPSKEAASDFLLVVDTGAGFALITGSEGPRTAEDTKRIVGLLKVTP